MHKTKNKKIKKEQCKNNKLTFWFGLTTIILSVIFILSILLEYIGINFTSRFFTDPYHVMVTFLVPILILNLASTTYYTFAKEKIKTLANTGITLGTAGILLFSIFNISIYFIEGNLRFEFLFISANVLLISMGALALSLIINKSKTYSLKKSPEKNEEFSFFFGTISSIIAISFVLIVLLDYFLIFGMTGFSIMHLFLAIFSEMSIIFIILFTLTLVSSITSIIHYNFTDNKSGRKAFLGLSLAVFGIIFFLAFIFIMYSLLFF